MYNDKNHIDNSEKHHTGRPCIEENCNNPAGTFWSPFWCFECNVKRIDRITKNLEDFADRRK